MNNNKNNPFIIDTLAAKLFVEKHKDVLVFAYPFSISTENGWLKSLLFTEKEPFTTSDQCRCC